MPICDFPLVIHIHTNLHPISHRFELIADYWSNLHFEQRGNPLWHIRSGWTPKLRTTKFNLQTKNIALSYGVHIFTENYVVCHNTGVWQTDRRTDGQTHVDRKTVRIYASQSHGKFGNKTNKMCLNHTVNHRVFKCCFKCMQTLT